ncbi:leukemia inhibitory factor receptor [Discoglossus pictus]
MSNKLLICLSLATIFFIFPDHVHSQSGDSSDFFQNVTCLTHNLETLVCSWSPANSIYAGIEYEICYSSSRTNKCFDTNETQIEIEFEIFSTVDITLTAKNVSGSPRKRFQTSTQDIAFIPHTPEVISLTSDPESDTLYAEWSVNSSAFINGVEVDWEVQVLRSENLDLVATELLNTHWNESKTIFHWGWTSDIPLPCTSYSVRVRCYYHEEYFNDKIGWSEWSALKTVYGSTKTTMLYDNRVIAVGSNASFCCIAEDDITIGSMGFENTILDMIPLSRNSSGIRVYNLSMSRESGYNAFCSSTPDIGGTFDGAVLFVGYPPDKPQNFSCETRDLQEIICTWHSGRLTGFYSVRGTVYMLHERYSGKNASYNPTDENGDCKSDNNQYECKIDVTNGQNLYYFSLNASNPLGRSDGSVVFNATERIYPKSPEKVIVQDVSSTEILLSYHLSGNFDSIKLVCEVEIKNSSDATEMRNFTISGLNSGNYNINIDNLHPFKVYDFRVRCAAFEFWKWSDWSVGRKHYTLSAAPSRKIDIWREVIESSESRTVIVYWKHLSTSEANGRIHSYRVSWRPLNSDLEPKYTILPATANKTQINFDHTDKMDYEITVVANNTAGLSPSSRITTVQLPNNDVVMEYEVGAADGINITWPSDANVSCGHVVQWRPSSPSQSSRILWRRVLSSRTSTFIKSEQFYVGVRYNVSVYGCKDSKYQLLKNIIGYTKELAPKVAPNFTVEETTSSSVQIRWDAISEDNLQGFLQGYLVYVVKQEGNASVANFREMVGRTETKVINITDLSVKLLKIQALQGGTSYNLGLQAYTGGGNGPIKSSNVVTNDNAIGLILAILIPIVIAVVLGIVTTTICYRKREWIKETFYPDIPNPENSKALQFQKNVSEGNNTIKTLEMNHCTPNNVEVVETLSTVPKILDTELHSPATEDGLDTEDENHVVVSYCPPSANEDTSNQALDGSAVSSQVTYVDIQSMYQPQANSEEEPENDFLDRAGYKPQMQLPITTVNMENHTPAEEDLATAAGYRPQENPNAWAADSPGSSPSVESNSENASFGSPCSITSRHFLIPPVDDKDSLKPTHIGWSLTSLFQNKQDE